MAKSQLLSERIERLNSTTEGAQGTDLSARALGRRQQTQFHREERATSDDGETKQGA